MSPSSSLINQAVRALRAGQLVAFPTETVYGLGADANNPLAVQAVFAAKERPAAHPLIVHIANIDQLTQYARDIPASAYELARAFWPGPLTLILKKQPGVLTEVTGGQETVAIRIPNHPLALELLREFGSGLVAPSANKFMHISPTTAEAVASELGSSVALILDGGPCAVGLESTIIDLSTNEPQILRPGMVSREQVTQILKAPLGSKTSDIRAPGMHERHYAPVTNAFLLTSLAIRELLPLLTQPTALICHSADIVQVAKANPNVHIQQLSATPEAYAHDLYQTLRYADQSSVKQIFIEALPQTAAWEAINDRLMRACTVI